MICVLSAGKTLAFAAGAFMLSWTHSVEKTRWQERWTAGPQGLQVIEGRIEGSGAGMDPPPDAVLKDGAYVYAAHAPAIPELLLAASGATKGGWTFCPDGEPCRILGALRGEPIRIRWRPSPPRSSETPCTAVDRTRAYGASASDPETR